MSFLLLINSLLVLCNSNCNNSEFDCHCHASHVVFFASFPDCLEHLSHCVGTIHKSVLLICHKQVPTPTEEQ